MYYVLILSPNQNDVYYKIHVASFVFCDIFENINIITNTSRMRSTDWVVDDSFPTSCCFISVLLVLGTLTFRFLLALFFFVLICFVLICFVLFYLFLFLTVCDRHGWQHNNVLYGQGDTVHQVACTIHPFTFGWSDLVVAYCCVGIAPTHMSAVNIVSVMQRQLITLVCYFHGSVHICCRVGRVRVVSQKTVYRVFLCARVRVRVRFKLKGSGLFYNKWRNSE